MAIAATLASPTRTDDQGNNKTNYYSWVRVVDTQGRLIRQVETVVTVSRTNLQIITAFYRS